MVEIANQVFPPGLVQALGGDDKLGPALVDHPDIHKISFTGSIATGKKVMAAAAKTVKRVTLEMGGNDPSIVLQDADIGKVAPLVAMVCPNPLLLHCLFLTLTGRILQHLPSLHRLQTHLRSHFHVRCLPRSTHQRHKVPQSWLLERGRRYARPNSELNAV